MLEKIEGLPDIDESLRGDKLREALLVSISKLNKALLTLDAEIARLRIDNQTMQTELWRLRRK